MKRSYTARGPHKRPCDLCGAPVLPGDRMETWCYVHDDPPPLGDIIRVHASCSELRDREGIDEWVLCKAFSLDAGYAPSYGFRPNPGATDLELEAAAQLAAARAETLPPPRPSVRVCPRCGHSPRYHRLAGSEGRGRPLWSCTAGVRTGDDLEFCECDHSPAAAVPCPHPSRWPDGTCIVCFTREGAA